MKTSTEPPSAAKYPLLLYDGVCGFCNKSVQIVLKHDRKGQINFAPLQSNLAQSLLKESPELSGADTVVFLEKDDAGRVRTYCYSSAALRIARYLDYPWKLITIANLVPGFLRDYFYRLFARHRYRLFGRYDTCMIPPNSVRKRFLDLPEIGSTKVK